MLKLERSIRQQPDSRERTLFQLVAMTMASALPHHAIPSIFVHANVDLAREMMSHAAALLHAGRVETIAINGLSAADCEALNVNYSGYEDWVDYLTDKMKVPPSLIVRCSPARHTYEEAAALHRLATENAWAGVAFLSSPYHLLRCLLTQLAAMDRLNVSHCLYPITIPWVEWSTLIGKQLLSGETIKLSRAAMLEEEWDRIVRYQASGDCAEFDRALLFLRQQHG